jgi:hypothetical protein
LNDKSLSFSSFFFSQGLVYTEWRIIFVVAGMKQSAATILLTIYFAFSTGLVVNLHYCMDRFDSMQIGAAKSEVCGKCGMHTTESNGCCHDAVKILKIDDDQLTGGYHFKFQTAIAANTPVYFQVESLLVNAGFKILQNNHSPPISKQDTYLQNCVFRI